MIHFDIQWHAFDPHGNMPVVLYDRPRIHNEPKAWAGASEVAWLGRYWVPQLSLFGHEKNIWTVTQSGPKVRIPVHAYRTESHGLAAIWGMGIEIGMAAEEAFRSYCSETPKSAVLLLGHMCDDLGPEGGFRCYVGLAIQTEDIL